MSNSPTCFLCGAALTFDASNEEAKKKGHKLHDGYGKNPNAKTEMHFGHVKKRGGRKEFKSIPTEVWQRMGISNPIESVLACYECHEVVMHNPVFNKSQLENLAPHFEGKDFIGKVIVLNKILEAGLNNYEE